MASNPSSTPDPGEPNGAADDAPRPVVRRDVSRGEKAVGLGFLSLGAAVSCALEVIYLGLRVEAAGAAIAMPITVVLAFSFNLVLTRTALLWDRRPGLAGLPLFVWLAVYVGFLLIPLATGDVSGCSTPSVRSRCSPRAPPAAVGHLLRASDILESPYGTAGHTAFIHVKRARSRRWEPYF